MLLLLGRIEQKGSPLELYDRPANLFVAGFIGSPSMNFLPATLRRSPRHAQEIFVETLRSAIAEYGDGERARGAFEALAARPETRILGLHGLFIEARRQNDHEAARHFAAAGSELTVQELYDPTINHYYVTDDDAGAAAGAGLPRHGASPAAWPAGR